MANTVGPILAPLVDAWNWYTKDHVLESLIEFKGGA